MESKIGKTEEGLVPFDYLLPDDSDEQTSLLQSKTGLDDETNKLEYLTDNQIKNSKRDHRQDKSQRTQIQDT